MSLDLTDRRIYGFATEEHLRFADVDANGHPAGVIAQSGPGSALGGAATEQLGLALTPRGSARESRLPSGLRGCAR